MRVLRSAHGRRALPLSTGLVLGPQGNPGAFADLTKAIGVQVPGATGVQSTNWTAITTGHYDSDNNSPYNFTSSANGCSFETTSAGTSTDIGNASFGQLVTGSEPTFVPYQEWTPTLTFAVLSVSLCWGSFGSTDAVRKPILDSVAAGNADMDSAFTTVATRAVSSGLGSRLIVRPGWECTSVGGGGAGTGNYPWTALNIEADYVSAFQRAVTKMRAVAGFNALIEWNSSAFPGGSWDPSAYPGDAYVDVIGVDLYDETPAGGAVNSVATQAASFAQVHNKRFGISELGYLTAVGDDTTWTNNVINFLEGLPAQGQAGGLAYAILFDRGLGGTSTLDQIPNSAALWKTAAATGT